jgi:lipopolysaccharide/colanic/teichoic acid biosynthesis glycosyltransferase
MYKETVELKIRRSLDFVFSFFMILLLSPVFVMIAFAIRFEDGGSVFVTQKRAGKNGHQFPVYRFRTMRANPIAEMISLPGQNEQSGPVFKIMIDPKVTRIGRILRKTSMDNLPHYFNVIRGDMSFAGLRL